MILVATHCTEIAVQSLLPIILFLIFSFDFCSFVWGFNSLGLSGSWVSGFFQLSLVAVMGSTPC